MARDEKTYGFSRADAEALAKGIRANEYEYPEIRPRGGNSGGAAIFFTAAGGIPGRSGTNLGQAAATKVSIDGIALITLTGQSDTVYNLSTVAVGGSKYIQCLRIQGKWIANWEQCD